MRDFIEFFAPLIIGVLVIVALLIGASVVFGQYQCDQYQKVTGKETRYVKLDECYVKTPQGFQRWDEYKTRAIASEGLKK